MKKFITSKKTFFVAGILAFILGWEILSILIDKNNLILPGPKDTFIEMGKILRNGGTYLAILFSLEKLVLGFVISFVLAFILGVIVHDNEKLYSFFQPLMIFLKSVPTASLIFLFIVLSGVANAPMIVVITVTFPILYEGIVSAFKNSDKTIIEASKMDGANKLASLFKVQLPNGIPYIILGVVSSFSLAFKVEIMAEVISGYTNGGLGSLIRFVKYNEVTLTSMFSYSIIAVVLMILITLFASLVTKKIKKSIA